MTACPLSSISATCPTRSVAAVRAALYISLNAGATGSSARTENARVIAGADIRIARGGGKAYDNEGSLIKQYKGNAGKEHAQNFIDGVRSGSSRNLAADIEVGHLGTAVCHQANIAWRAGAEASVDEVRENVKHHGDALNTLSDMLEQLDGNGVDLAKDKFVLGPALTYDRKTERFVGANAEKGNKYITCSHRAPFVMPKGL